MAVWKKHSEIMLQALQYTKDRAEGKIKSLQTQWRQFNRIGLNGIEWNSIYILSSRPGVGKTLLVNSIGRALQGLNLDQDFAILHFQFEMMGRNVALRELSGGTNMNIRYIQSAQDDGMPPLSQIDFNRLIAYSKSQSNREEYIIDKAMTVPEIALTIKAFYEEVKKPFVITLDHTLLVKQHQSESNKQQTLESLSTMMIDIKNHYPVTFIVLSQLNRSIDDSERQKPGTLGNYPIDPDVYASDFLLQGCDVMIAYNRPAKYNLAVYGPDKYVITPQDKYLLAAHILKNRFGETGIQWYRAEYAQMTIIETEVPAKQIRRI